MSEAELVQSDIGKWLEDHHRVEDKGRTDGDEIHVFAVEEGPVYGLAADKKKSWQVHFSLGPITIRLVIEIDFTKGTISICAYGKVPILPEFKIGCVTGSLKDGVTIKFSLSVIKGSFHFYVKDKWLWVHYDVTVFGKHWKGDIKLIPLPI